MSDYPVPYALPDDTPEKAPMPAFDPNGANYFDMFAPTYYNLDTVQALTKEGGGKLLLQVKSVDVEYVYDPSKGEDSGDWRPVVSFVGGGPKLVLNQTRSKVMMNASRSIHVGEWQRVGWLELWAGIENGHAQILIAPAEQPRDVQRDGSADGNGEQAQTIDELNEELFG